MRIGIPRETYPLEKRVIFVPEAIRNLVKAGHEVFAQTFLGSGIDVSDADYQEAGAKIIAEAKDLYDLVEMVVKVKVPSSEEFSLMKDLILFCMFHGAQNPSHIYYAGRQNLMVVEMESIRDEKNKRLIDQTDITGKAGVYYALQHSQKMPEDMRAVILGYGNVSSGAMKACARLGIEYKIVRRKELKFLPQLLKDADLLINGITWPDSQRAKKEYLVTREDIQNSPRGMIILDLSVDFPNPIETIRPTNYSNPYYIEEGRVHISIYGYPGLFPVTSSHVYSKQVEPLALLIADNGGLEGIGQKGEIGLAIKKAIINPHNVDWQQYQPIVMPGSKIE